MKLYAVVITSFGPSTIGPFYSQEDRDAATRAHLTGQNADASDDLLFADLEEDGRLTTYRMDLDDYLEEEP